eukprot:6180529-Pleurochrysis_carterae.AAC.2
MCIARAGSGGGQSQEPSPQTRVRWALMPAEPSDTEARAAAATTSPLGGRRGKKGVGVRIPFRGGLRVETPSEARSSMAVFSRTSSHGSENEFDSPTRASMVVNDESLSSHFMSYIPTTLALRYAAMQSPQPPTEPERREFAGVVGFIDVSGFTALAEKLSAEQGRRGAELLNQYVNSYFEQLIELVAASEGDVIKFAGDALQVVWRSIA